jgi:hypothetical protein
VTSIDRYRTQEVVGSSPTSSITEPAGNGGFSFSGGEYGRRIGKWFGKYSRTVRAVCQGHRFFDADQPQEDPTLRERLTAEREDDLSYLMPSKPSELRSLPDDELFRLWRKFMFANKWPLP